MKTNSLFVAILLGIGVCINTRAISVSGLYNTGVDDSGEVIPLHAVEQHWLVQGPVDTVYRVPIVYQGTGEQAWVTPPEGSAWIGPNPTDSTWPYDPPGLYVYRLTFSLSFHGLDPSGLLLTGRWASDDWSKIWLNGQFTGIERTGIASEYLVDFTIQGIFVDGVNILEFHVENFNWPQYPQGNPTGLLVADLQAVYRGLSLPPPVTVPEGGHSFVCFFCGLVSLAAVRPSRLRAIRSYRGSVRNVFRPGM